jgi:RNA polymerase sigma-70 factor (ECF subfamily)
MLSGEKRESFAVQRESNTAGSRTAGPTDALQAGNVALAGPPSQEEADEELVRKAALGSVGAFDVLVVRYQDRVYNVLARMCGSPDEAEDLAQETFLKAYRALGAFRQGSKFYTWLFRIAVNLAVSHRRRSGRMRILPLSDCSEGQPSNAATPAEPAGKRNPAPDSAAISAETAKRVAAELDALDEEFRVVLILRDIEDMDYAQIASVLDLPVGTVKSRLHRARCILKERLIDLVQ